MPRLLAFPRRRPWSIAIALWAILAGAALLVVWGIYRHDRGRSLTPTQVELLCRSVPSLSGKLRPFGRPMRQTWGWIWDGTVPRAKYAVDLVFSCQLPDLAPRVVQVRESQVMKRLLPLS